jgi:NAD(P)-dependent dehydrogenase (short-subunit alcohol dehydrogenase family)
MKNDKKIREITITGSEGLVGSELCKYFEKTDNVKKLDIRLGHDLLDESFVKNWFKNNKSDYLINCFALNDHIATDRKKHTLYDITLESFSNYLQTNLVSLFSVCREFARNKKSIGIVNFSSTYGLVSPKPSLYKGFHKDIGYGVSKAGVLNLSKYLAVHLAPKIRVNSIVPGGIKLSQDKKFIKNYSELTPMNRMMNKTELNGLVDFLCSKKSSYVTGSTIIADGGYTAW